MDLRLTGGRRRVISVRVVSFLTLVFALFTVCAAAQVTDAGSQGSNAEARTYQTLYLTGTVQRHTATNIVTDLRNCVSRAKIYYVPEQNAISIIGTPDEIQLARKIVSDMSRSRTTYRLTYTITESGGDQPAKTREVALLVGAGERMNFKEGNRVPVVTGMGDAGNPASTQVQYLDVGLNITASVGGTADHLSLSTKIEQSGVVEGASGARAQDPVVSQTMLNDTLTLVQGKPVVLGSLDVPGSSRHMTIEVVSQPVG